MADYREISQEYARGGIKAAMTINGGAAIALLTQAASFIEKGLAQSVSCSLYLWAAGVALSAAAWLPAFLSTRHVDRSERDPQNVDAELKASNCYMYLGLGFILFSIICFIFGAVTLGQTLGAAAMPPALPDQNPSLFR